jgi:hypothetical protein
MSMSTSQGRLDPPDRQRLAVILDLAERVPAHLLILPPDEIAALHASLAALRAQVRGLEAGLQ